MAAVMLRTSPPPAAASRADQSPGRSGDSRSDLRGSATGTTHRLHAEAHRRGARRRLPDVRQPARGRGRLLVRHLELRRLGLWRLHRAAGFPCTSTTASTNARRVARAGETQFHAECIAASSSVDADGRRFDSLASQIARNGDAIATAGHEDGRRGRRVEEPARDPGRGPRAHRPVRNRDARQRRRRLDAAPGDREAEVAVPRRAPALQQLRLYARVPADAVVRVGSPVREQAAGVARRPTRAPSRDRTRSTPPTTPRPRTVSTPPGSGSTVCEDS